MNTTFMCPVDASTEDRRKNGALTLDWTEQGIADELSSNRFARVAFMELVKELHELREMAAGVKAS